MINQLSSMNFNNLWISNRNVDNFFSSYNSYFDSSLLKFKNEIKGVT